MTHRAPSIVGVFSSGDGGFDVHWAVDTFFPDSDAPEKVFVDLNGVAFKELDGDEDSVEVPVAVINALGSPAITVSVSFWWPGPPAEELQSSLVVPVSTGSVAGNAGVFTALQPLVKLVGI